MSSHLSGLLFPFDVIFIVTPAQKTEFVTTEVIPLSHRRLQMQQSYCNFNVES